jgi:hypothetical protein
MYTGYVQVEIKGEEVVVINTTVIDEKELIEVIEEYFDKLRDSKKQIRKYLKEEYLKYINELSSSCNGDVLKRN